jgi:hypothetical protein
LYDVALFNIWWGPGWLYGLGSWITLQLRRGFTPGFVNYKNGCTRLATANDKDCQLLAHSRWISLGTQVSFITKTGRHDIAEILLKVTLNTINQIKSINIWWDSGLLIPFKLLYIVYCAFDIIQINDFWWSWQKKLIFTEAVSSNYIFTLFPSTTKFCYFDYIVILKCHWHKFNTIKFIYDLRMLTVRSFSTQNCFRSWFCMSRWTNIPTDRQ